MKRFVVLAALIACKGKDVPFKPPPPEDAPARPIDAPDVDAAVATVAPKPTKIVVGDHTSCAILADATLRCWGKNSDGQLGIGTTADSPKPVKPNLLGVIDIVLGSAHACALLDDHSVTCWGRINYGHKENLLVPTAPPGLRNVKAIFAVGNASCATVDSGSLVCWGDIDLKGHPRLAGTTIERRIPTPSDGLSDVTSLTVNGALHANGSVTFVSSEGVPAKTSLTGVKEIAAAGDEVCGLREDGSVACVGPTTHCAAKRPAPKKAPPPPKKKGKKAPKAAPRPQPELEVETLALPAAKHLAFDVGLCVVTKGGALQCLDARDNCKVDSPWPGLSNVDTVSGSCARSRDGVVKCWSVDRKSRVVSQVSGVTTARELAVSSTHGCVLSSDRKIVCWGSNKYGALGRGESDDDLHRDGRVVEF